MYYLTEAGTKFIDVNEETPKGGYGELDAAVHAQKIAALRKFYKGRFRDGPGIPERVRPATGKAAKFIKRAQGNLDKFRGQQGT